MEDFLKMDVFFVVATIVAVVVGLLVSVALYYVIRLLRIITHITEQVEEEAITIRKDIAEVRTRVHKEGLRFKLLSGLLEKTGKRLLSRGSRKH